MTVITQGTLAGDLNIPFVCLKCGNANHHYQTIKFKFTEHGVRSQLLILSCEVCHYSREASIDLNYNQTTKD